MPESRAVQRKRSGLSIDLSGLAGSPEMAKANPQFLQDEESWRASTGDYKSKFDGSKPYKSPGFFGRLAKNPGDLKNTEYMLDKEAMRMEQGFKQDMAKMDLANRLAERGYVAQAQKVQAEIDYNNDLTKMAVGASNQQTTDALRAKSEKQNIKVSGKQTRESGQQSADLSLRNLKAEQLGQYNIANDRFPGQGATPDMIAITDENFMEGKRLVPDLQKADLLGRQGEAVNKSYRNVGNAAVNLLDPGREAFVFNEGQRAIPGDGINAGVPAIAPSLEQKHLNVAPFVPPISDADAAAPGVTPGAGKVKITAKPDDEYDTAIKGVFNNTPFSHSSYKGATRGEMMDMFNMAVGADNGIMPESIGDSVFYSYPFGRLPIDEQQRLYNNLNPRQKRQTSLLLQNMSQGK
jgi:hypothetical protein